MLATTDYLKKNHLSVFKLLDVTDTKPPFRGALLFPLSPDCQIIINQQMS